jgi:site-specific DNA-adenine methylase
LWLSPHKGVSELVNDLNDRLINFWRALRSDDTFRRFSRQVEATPLSRAEWEAAHAHEYGSDPVANAVAFFVACRQSLAGHDQFHAAYQDQDPAPDERQRQRVAWRC